MRMRIPRAWFKGNHQFGRRYHCDKYHVKWGHRSKITFVMLFNKRFCKMVRYAKMEQMKVTAEVCPHHFTLTSDDIHKVSRPSIRRKNFAIDADAVKL